MRARASSAQVFGVNAQKLWVVGAPGSFCDVLHAREGRVHTFQLLPPQGMSIPALLNTQLPPRVLSDHSLPPPFYFLAFRAPGFPDLSAWYIYIYIDR